MALEEFKEFKIDKERQEKFRQAPKLDLEFGEFATPKSEFSSERLGKVGKFVSELPSDITTPVKRGGTTIASIGKAGVQLGQAGIEYIKGDREKAMEYAIKAGQPIEFELPVLGEFRPLETTKEAVGAGLEIAGWLLPGVSKVSTKGAKTGYQAFKMGFKKALPYGLTRGGLFGAGGALSDNAEIAEVVKQGAIGATVGVLFEGILTGYGARKRFLAPERAKELMRKAKDQYMRALETTKEKYKEKAGEIIPDLLKEGRKGTLKQIRQKAERQVALSLDDYVALGNLQGASDVVNIEKELVSQINALKIGPTQRVASINRTKFRALQDLLGDVRALKGTIELATPTTKQLIGSLQDNVSLQIDKTFKKEAGDVIRSMDFSGVNTLDDAAKMIKNALPKNKAVVDAVDLWSQSLNSWGIIARQGTSAQSLRELGGQYGNELFASRKAQKTITDNAKLSQVRKVDAAIRDLLGTQFPAYAKINKVYHLNTELLDIMRETTLRKGGHKWLSLGKKLAGGGGGTTGAVIGTAMGGPVGGMIGAVAGGSGLIGLTTLVESAWWNTMRAVHKAKIAEKLLALPAKKLSPAISKMVSGGVKAVMEFIQETPVEE